MNQVATMDADVAITIAFCFEAFLVALTAGLFIGHEIRKSGAETAGESTRARTPEARSWKENVMTTAATSFDQPRMDIARAAPPIHHALVTLGRQVELNPRLRELVNLRASILNGCAYCIDMHTRIARKGGETEQRLYAVAAWHETPFFDAKERAALQLTDAVTLIAEQHVPRDVWDEASAHFEPDELAQLVWAITVINAWNRIAITTRMQSASRSDRVDRVDRAA